MRWQHTRLRRHVLPAALIVFIVFMTYTNWRYELAQSGLASSEESHVHQNLNDPLADISPKNQSAPLAKPPSNQNPQTTLAAIPAAPAPGKTRPETLQAHVYRPDGLVELNEKGRHPIYDLIERARQRWDEKLSRQSKTLQQAVEEYKRRYKRPPPPGFDKWWEYVVQHEVQLPDEYDFLHRNLEPFWGVDPVYLEERRKEWEDHAEVFTIGKEKLGEKIKLLRLIPAPNGDAKNGEWRANLQKQIVEDVGQHIPGFKASFISGDVPYQFWGHPLRNLALEAAKTQKHMNFNELPHQPYLGWASACPSGAPLHLDVWENHPSPQQFHQAKPKTFIHDHLASMDPCHHPELVHIVGYLSNHGRGPGPSSHLNPAFAISTTLLHGDILAVSPEGYTEEVGPDPEWKMKRDSRLFWRGSNTGASFSDDHPWNISMRARLIAQSMEHDVKYDVLQPGTSQTVIPLVKSALSQDLNRFLDVGFAGSPIQCSEEICDILKKNYAFKQHVDQEEANQYKYLLDVDGNAWSARFKRLMSTNSCILKSTMFPEWYADRIQPWLHYIPVKVDLSDLYDILEFFHGGERQEAMAEGIATAGKQWSLKYYRREDMTAYMFRLYLEYARVMSVDRKDLKFEL